MINDCKANPGCIARPFGMQVDANFILSDSFKQLGKQGMGTDVQPLPIGWVMAVNLAL